MIQIKIFKHFKFGKFKWHTEDVIKWKLWKKKIDNFIKSISTNSNTINTKCLLCAVGNFLTDKTKKCAVCEIPVHTLPLCYLLDQDRVEQLLYA